MPTSRDPAQHLMDFRRWIAPWTLRPRTRPGTGLWILGKKRLDYANLPQRITRCVNNSPCCLLCPGSQVFSADKHDFVWNFGWCHVPLTHLAQPGNPVLRSLEMGFLRRRRMCPHVGEPFTKLQPQWGSSPLLSQPSFYRRSAQADIINAVSCHRQVVEQKVVRNFHIVTELVSARTYISCSSHLCEQGPPFNHHPLYFFARWLSLTTRDWFPTCTIGQKSQRINVPLARVLTYTKGVSVLITHFPYTSGHLGDVL